MHKNIKDWCLAWAGALLCLSYLLPNHYSPWLSFHQEFVAALAFGPLVIYAAFSTRFVSWGVVALVAFSTVPLLQMVFGQLYFATDGWMAFVYILGFALVVHAGICLRHKYSNEGGVFSKLTSVWLGVLVAALVSVAISACQWLMIAGQGIYIAEMPPNGRPFGNLAQPNQLATLLLLGLMGLMALWELRKIGTLLTLATAILLIFGLVLSGSRSVVLALLWLVPLFFWMRRRCHLRITWLAMIALIAIYAALTIFWVQIDNFILSNQGGIGIVDRMSAIGIRKIYWVSMYEAVLQSPWIGYGWGQISVAQIATVLNYSDTFSTFESAHNLFIDLAVWNGLPLALIVVVGVLTWCFFKASTCRDPGSWTLLIAVFIVFNHAMVEYPLSYSYFLLPVGFFAGLLTEIERNGLSLIINKFPNAIRGFLGFFAVSLFALVFVVAAEYFPLEKDWQLMRFQQANIGNSKSESLPDAKILIGIREFLKFSRVEPSTNMTAEEIEWMRKVSSRYAYGSSMYKYAVAQALNSNGKGAQKTLRKLCSMQSVSLCLSARRQWYEVEMIAHPELNGLEFPEIPSNRRNY